MQDNEETSKICIIFVSIMYCLLYKQVQSALNSYHNEHARLTQQKGRVKFTEDGAEKRSSWLL